MKKIDILNFISEYISKYYRDNPEEVFSSIFGGVTEEDTEQSAITKIAIDSSRYAAQVSAMTVLAFLADAGVLPLDEKDDPESVQSWEDILNRFQSGNGTPHSH